jgi:hypothetical protein
MCTVGRIQTTKNILVITRLHDLILKQMQAILLDSLPEVLHVDPFRSQPRVRLQDRGGHFILMGVDHQDLPEIRVCHIESHTSLALRKHQEQRGVVGLDSILSVDSMTSSQAYGHLLYGFWEEFQYLGVHFNGLGIHGEDGLCGRLKWLC